VIAGSCDDATAATVAVRLVNSSRGGTGGKGDCATPPPAWRQDPRNCDFAAIVEESIATAPNKEQLKEEVIQKEP